MKRFVQKGYFLNGEVLQECVQANLGDLTFEEAYIRSKRILNITVATSGNTGIPNLLNYLTAPNVVCELDKDQYHFFLLTIIVNLVCCTCVECIWCG